MPGAGPATGHLHYLLPGDEGVPGMGVGYGEHVGTVQRDDISPILLKDREMMRKIGTATDHYGPVIKLGKSFNGLTAENLSAMQKELKAQEDARRPCVLWFLARSGAQCLLYGGLCSPRVLAKHQRSRGSDALRVAR